MTDRGDAADVEASRVNLFLHAENTRIFQTDQLDRRLPVTVVTGYLGCGKTTLLRHILTNRSNLRIAAAINDFAELNIDRNLVKHVNNGAERIVELSNGCVCCHLLDDLKDAIFQLLEAGGDVDTDAVNYLVVETSGVTDPMSVVRTLDAKFGKTYRARLDAVVTVVDSDQFLHSPLPSAEAVAQLTAADVVLMNKVDLLKDDAQRDLVEGRIRSYNSSAEVYRTVRSTIPLHKILDVSPADTNKGNGDTIIPITHEQTSIPFYVSSTGGSLRREGSSSINNAANGSHLRGKSNGYNSLSVKLDKFPLSLLKLQQFITSPQVQKLARMKGVLWIRGISEYRCVLHLSGRGRLGFELDGRWSGPPSSELAFIGSDIDTAYLEQAFSECCVVDEDQSATRDDQFIHSLSQSQSFDIVNHESKESDDSITYFRISGSKFYGYTEDQIERDFRIDTNAMNLDLADAVNASVANEEGRKAFLAHSEIHDEMGRKRVVLCYAGGEPANDLEFLSEEASKVLATHFRNVSDCRCGK